MEGEEATVFTVAIVAHGSRFQRHVVVVMAYAVAVGVHDAVSAT
jgi:hypothetical protein